MALRLVEKDSSTKVVVIRGAGGKAFIAGVNVKDHSEEKGEEMGEAFTSLMHGLISVGKPTIAAVAGVCSGGGFEVAMYCDMVVAEEGAKFSQPEIKLAVKSLATLKLTRYAIYRAYDMEFRKAFEWVDDVYSGKVMHTEDFKEGLSSFFEKRKPAWKNR